MKTAVRVRCAALACALATLAVAACGDDSPEPPPGRGITRGTATQGTEPAASRLVAPSTPVKHFALQPLNRPPSPRPSAGAANAPPPAPPAAPARDLPAELIGLAGDPSGCFGEALERLPELVRIDLTATVTPQGIVTRAGAAGSGVPADARACIVRRIEHAHFRALVPDAPRTIRARLTLRRQPRPHRPETP